MTFSFPTKLALALLALVFALVTIASAQVATSPTPSGVASFLDADGNPAEIVCTTSERCTVMLTVSFKKATALLAEQLPSKQDSVLVTLPDEILIVRYADKRYSLPVADSLASFPNVSDTRKALRDELRRLIFGSDSANN